MAVNRQTAQGSTVTQIYNGACRIKKIEVRAGAAAAPELFLQVFNNYNPTVGTTQPNVPLRVVPGDSAINNPWQKYIFAGSYGGMYFGTGLAIAVTTTPTGSTGPTAGQEPEVIVTYEPLS